MSLLFAGGSAGRRVALAAAIAIALAAQASVADADTLDRQRYHERLDEVRVTLQAARSAEPAARPALLDRARAILRGTTALRLDDGTTIAVDDGRLAGRIGPSDADLDAAIGDVGLLAALAERRAAIDPVAAEARLRQLVGEHRARAAQVTLIDVLAREIARFLAGLRGGPPDARVLVVLVGGLGLALLAVVLAIMGRDLRERFRREVVLPELREARAADPTDRLREGEDAFRQGRLRDAIHALYLYAIAALAAREAIRFDPSLTDRELLASARAIPHADALRDLVELHERVWYGLRAPRGEDADRARSLALRAAA